MTRRPCPDGTTCQNRDHLDDAEALLREALDLWHGTHELCDVADTPEWFWRWRVAYLLDQAEPAQ